MKKLTVLLFGFLLSGCFIYSAEDDCIYGLTSTQCFGDEYTTIARLQKRNYLGKTDSQQRWYDFESCGGKGRDPYLRWTNREEHADREGILRNQGKIFWNCMEQKGYVFIEDCGRKNSTTDKGICNE
ncbi:hypothetical protein B0186_00585 [Canicola haemoglobinophilus]|uniref:Lipoprotein n=1 Tax=Canicola haemoglobinophilus TaxID=733 RepID=A0A1V4B3Y7_9PAST|nr:hypothetical protein [Canicola haemoglobinophilus]OOS02141.1 hypothetical protein B0186_00585 [Canicola haemoglobinophilus]STO59562.1 Uncharacterised protein [Canicola haemoglobinophilus]